MRIPDNAELIYSRGQIDAAMNTLADQINDHFKDTRPLVLSVLQGGLVFAGHLLTRLSFPLDLDYIHASRYRGNFHGETIKWAATPGSPIEGREILLLDDIYDQGFTLEAVNNWCLEQGARQVHAAVLVRKRHSREQSTYKADFIGLDVEDDYVFGFGMDRNHLWRNANGIFKHT